MFLHPPCMLTGTWMAYVMLGELANNGIKYTGYTKGMQGLTPKTMRHH